MTPAEAVQIAIEGEEAAAAFYKGLAEMTADVQVRRFFEDMAHVEGHHADSIQRANLPATTAECSVDCGELEPSQVEMWPKWSVTTECSLEDSIHYAIAAELNAAAFYARLAQCYGGGAVGTFFEYLANTERMHATLLEAQRQKLSVGSVPPAPIDQDE